MLTAIITGVSRGLGEALAEALLARDAWVTGIGRASSSRLVGDRYQFIACDLSQTSDIATTLQKPFAAIAATLSHLIITSRTARATVLIPALALPLAALGADPVALVMVVTLASGFCQTLMVSAKRIMV